MKLDGDIIKTTCKSCHGGCGVLASGENGRIVHIEGNPESKTRGTVCAKGLASIQEVRNPNRIMYPMKRKGERGGCQWQRIGWEEAIATVAGKMQETRERYGARLVAVCLGILG